jgi:hypothetical protein
MSVSCGQSFTTLRAKNGDAIAFSGLTCGGNGVGAADAIVTLLNLMLCN